MNVVFFIMLFTKQLWLCIFVYTRQQHWQYLFLLIRVTIIYMEIKELKQDSRSNEQSRLYFIKTTVEVYHPLHSPSLYLHIILVFNIHSEIRLFFCHDSPLFFFLFTKFILYASFCTYLHYTFKR